MFSLFGYIASARSRSVLTSPVQHRITSELYVPIKGKLVKKPLTRKMTSQSLAFGTKIIVLNEVIRQSPRYFPPSAKVLSLKKITWRNKVTKNKYSFFLLTLNEAFLNKGFWKRRGKENTLFAFHALARNIAFTNYGKSAPSPVRFVVKGKQVTKIGSFSTKYPLAPDKILESIRPTRKYVYSPNSRNFGG